MARFNWRARAAQLWNRTVGRVVPRLAMRQEAERVVTLSPVRLWANQVFTGELEVGAWQQAVRAELKTRYIQQYLAGRGGVGPMTQADYGSIGGMLADQYRYLDGFAREIAEGKLSEAQIARRLEMYLNSSREAFERGQARAMEVAGMDEVLWIKTAQESCEDCIALAGLGWQKAEPWPFRVGGQYAIPGSGSTACLTNCRCLLDWRQGGPRDVAEFNPYHVPAGSPQGGQFTTGPGGAGGVAGDSHLAQGERWINSLTEQEGNAVMNWGQSGYALRKLQSGHPEKIESERDRETAERLLPHWESAIAKGVPYDGVVHRGLSDVPESVLDKWQKEGSITLRNDQSATTSRTWAEGFSGSSYSRREVSVRWDVQQHSGIDLFGRTNVTYGGKRVGEGEVVLRNGTSYRIRSMNYFDRNGKPWPPPDYFEGTQWSLSNPPPGWRPHHDSLGYYVIDLEEVGR